METRDRLEEDERERMVLVTLLNDRKAGYELFRTERYVPFLADLDPRYVGPADRVRRLGAIQTEWEALIPEIQDVQSNLLDVEDQEDLTLEVLHDLRLRRGCTCCNIALRGNGQRYLN